MKNMIERLTRSVDEIRRRDARLSEELQEVRERARAHTNVQELAPLADVMPEAVDRNEFAVETIVLRTARPVLTVKRDEALLVFTPEDSTIWKQRLVDARSYLRVAIPAVGRIEVKNHPSYEWLGTGWLVSPDIVVTNRHVALEFGRRTEGRFVFRQGIGNQPLQASIDFIEELDRTESLEFPFQRILHIEDDDGPDIAFIQVKRADSQAVAQHIELAATAPDEDEYVAVVGYPARDSRIPEQDLMRRIFGDQYDKKRLAPGQITSTQDRVLLHDCSTLGGNSGSVVLSLSSGKAVGLHFAGRFLEANYAVPAKIIAELLNEISRAGSPRQPSTSTTPSTLTTRRASGALPAPDVVTFGRKIKYTIPFHVTVDVGVPVIDRGNSSGTADQRMFSHSTDTNDDLVISEARSEEYANRAGYDSEFLGRGCTVHLPIVTQRKTDILTFEFDGQSHEVLRYQHFSVVMSRSRRLCRYSAVNIDGKKSHKAKRPAWRRDPRIPSDAQITNGCYGNPPRFARGHMTRREDPIWGTEETARIGNVDSMHFTNVVPQMQPFNAGIWVGLEDYALDHAREDDMKISVFTGPFIRDDDPVRFDVQIPLTFWKIIAFIHDDTGELCATGYRMSQEAFLQETEFVFGQHKTAQVPIPWIEDQAGLSFSDLANLDPLKSIEEGLAGDLTDFSQICFVR